MSHIKCNGFLLEFKAILLSFVLDMHLSYYIYSTSLCNCMLQVIVIIFTLSQFSMLPKTKLRKKNHNRKFLSLICFKISKERLTALWFWVVEFLLFLATYTQVPGWKGHRICKVITAPYSNILPQHRYNQKEKSGNYIHVQRSCDISQPLWGYYFQT